MDPEPHTHEQVVQLMVRGMRRYTKLHHVRAELYSGNKIPMERTLPILALLEDACPPFFEQYKLRQLVLDQHSDFDELRTKWNQLMQNIQWAASGGTVPQVQEHLLIIDSHAHHIRQLAQQIHNIDPIVLAEPEQVWTTRGDGRLNPLLEYGPDEVALQQIHFKNHLRRNASILRDHAAQLRDSARQVVDTRVQNANQTQQLKRQIQQLNAQIQQLNAQIQQLQAQHAQQLAKQQALHDQKLAQLEAQHAQELAQQQALHDQQLAQLEAQHAQELAQQQAQHAQELAQQQAQHAQLDILEDAQSSVGSNP